MLLTLSRSWWPGVLALALLAGCQRGSGVDWSRKDAHRYCRPVVAASPAEPAPPCEAMHLCINEATLTAAERSKLLGMIRSAKGCAEP